jgi:outer membrane autotransporter protein
MIHRGIRVSGNTDRVIRVGSLFWPRLWLSISCTVSRRAVRPPISFAFALAAACVVALTGLARSRRLRDAAIRVGFVAFAASVALLALPGVAWAAVPTVTIVSPSSGSTAGGTAVTIIGTGFTGTTNVQFGAGSAASFTVVSATQVVASSPANSAGIVDITVTTPSGTSATSGSDQFTYVAPPVAGSVSAAVGNDSSANPITLDLSGGTATSVAVASGPSHGTATASGTSISYTPTLGYAGGDSFTYTASNNAGTSSPATVTIAVAAPTLSIGPSTVPGANAGVAYSQTFTATGGNAPYSYSVAAGSLPTGMTLNASTGVLSGTPSATGTFAFTVKATDSTTGPAAPFFVSQAYTLTVAAPVITVAPLTLPAPTVGTAYSQTVSAGGGTAPYAYTVSSGALPPGLTLNSATGNIFGTPTAGGSFAFSVQATDHNNLSGTASYTLTIGSVALSIAPASLSAGVPNASYSQQLVATGGTAPYTYSVVSGALPAGLSLSSAGLISGTPTTSGSSTFTVQARDSSSGTGPFAVTKSYVLAIGQTVPVAPAVTVTTQSNAPVTIHATANATGAPFTAVAIAMQPKTGTAVVNGQDIVYTPAATSSGNVGFTYTIANSAGVSAPVAVTVTVNAVPVVAAAQQVSTAATQTALIDITSGATGGPFTGASVVSVTPASAGTATIVNGTASPMAMKAAAAVQSGQFDVKFVPAAAFAGTAVINYTLSNAIATSAPGIISVVVAARPDPSTNPDVVGLIDAQVEAARRFANAQISNYGQRLESLHGTGHAPSANGISLALPGEAPEAPPACDDASAPTLRDACLRANQTLSAATSTPGESRQGDATPDKPSAAGGSLSDLAFWSAGVVDLGFNNAGTQRSGFRFTTPGVTAGADYRVSDQFSIGVGGGYGHDSTDIGSDGTKSTGDSYSFAVYGSYRPQPSLFVDGVAGFGTLSFDSRRWDDGASAFAVGQRNGRQTFASLSAGYERRTDTWLISPYARMSYSEATLDALSESGAGTDSLTYFGQTVTTVSGTLGLRAEYAQPTKWGILLPYARIEFQHDFNGQSTAGLAYADLGGAGPAYFVTSTPFGDNRTQLGVGSKFQMRSMTFGLDYTVVFGVNNFQQGVRLSFSAPF